MMTNAEELSVLVNVWAGDDPSLLEKSLASIAHQTLLPSKIIIVTDGPVGNLISNVLDSFEAGVVVPCKRCALHERHGLWAARNEGLSVCDTSWVALHDADDLMHPERLEILMQIALDEDADVVSSAILEIERPSNKVLGVRCPPLDDQGLRKRLARTNPLNHPTVVLKRDRVLSVGGYRDVYKAEDYDLWLRLFASDARFRQSDRALTLFSTGTQQLRRRGGWKFIQSEVELAMLKLRSGYTSLPHGLLIFLARLSYRLMPGPIKRSVHWRFVSRVRMLPHPISSEDDYLSSASRYLTA